MHVVFLTRDGLAGRVIYDRILRAGHLCDLVVESGRVARRAKLRRHFRNRGPLGMVEGVFDVGAIALYSSIVGRLVAQRIGQVPAFDSRASTPPLRVEDVNGTDCLHFLETRHPDLVLVLGTSILRQRTLDSCKAVTLNVHGGMVPRYRNVHCDFWAIARNDREHLGASILYLTRGIDNGDVALQAAVPVDACRTIVDAKVALIELSADLVEQALALQTEGRLPRSPQAPGEALRHRTPTFRDLAAALPRLIGR